MIRDDLVALARLVPRAAVRPASDPVRTEGDAAAAVYPFDGAPIVEGDDVRLEAVRRVRERASQTPAGKWIQGWGWQQSVWGGDFPTAQQIDAATSNHPIALTAKSGHAMWCNSLALHKAGITRDSADPIGGEIVRDANGEPTGVLLENATGLVAGIIPVPTQQEEEEEARKKR